MRIVTHVRTVNDVGGAPVLEIIKERGELLICDANNMDRNIKLSSAAIPALISVLGTLSVLGDCSGGTGSPGLTRGASKPLGECPQSK